MMDFMTAVTLERSLPAPPTSNMIGMLWQRVMPEVDGYYLDHSHERDLMWAPDSVAEDIRCAEIAERVFADFLSNFNASVLPEGQIVVEIV